MREQELLLAMRYMPPGARLLELGAGDGWQARALDANGFRTVAIDIDNEREDAGRHFDVHRYDGRVLPFPDGSFDVVFSSNVLEHLLDFPAIQREIARVLRPGGIALHCLPTATWRWVTTLTHPFYALRWVIRRLLAATPAPSSVRLRHPFDLGFLGMLRTGLFSPRHGEEGSLVSEHWLFSRWAWQRRFRDCRWMVRRRIPCGLFYSGNELCGSALSATSRRRLAKLFGSSTALYLLIPEGPFNHGT